MNAPATGYRELGLLLGLLAGLALGLGLFFSSDPALAAATAYGGAILGVLSGALMEHVA